MSWLEKLLPPKIQPTDPAERRSVPEGLWVKCPSCETVLYKNDLEANVNVCPKCGHHQRIRARARLDQLLDAEGRGDVVNVAAGVRFAMEQGAKVINLSQEAEPEIAERTRQFVSARSGLPRPVDIL